MATETLKIPDELAEALKSHKVIPFIGAGLSRAVEKKEKDASGNFNHLFPNWGELIERLAVALKTKEKHDDAEYILGCLKPTPKKYLEAMQHAKTALKDRNWYPLLDKELNLDKSLADESTLEATGNVWELGSNLLITTNIDKVLQWNCPNSNPPRILDAQTIEYGQLQKEHFPQNPTVWHLHGYIDNKEKIIFTEEQYKSFYDFNSNEAKLKTLLSFLTQHTFLFIGFSLDDPYFLEQIKYLQKIYGKSVGDYYVLFKKGTIVSEEIKELVEIVEYEDYGQPFLEKLKQLSDIAKESDDSKKKEEPKIEKEESTKTLETEKKPFFNVPFASKGKGFVGREDELEEIRQTLSEEGCASIGQAVSILAIGGVGKTQLAVEYAHTYQIDYPNGVFWVKANEDIMLEILQIAKTQKWINDTIPPKEQPDIAKNQFLKLRDCLLIFDNVEDVADIESFYNQPIRDKHILLTARENQKGFHPIRLSLLNDKESRELLLKTSNRSKLTAKDDEYLQKIISELGGLSLAIEMVGGYLSECPNISFEQFYNDFNNYPLDRIEENFEGESFTNHERSILKTLKLSEDFIKKMPLLAETLRILAWSGASPMGISLLQTLLDNNDTLTLNKQLGKGCNLNLLAHKTDRKSYEIHRLLGRCLRHEFPLEQNQEWHINIIERLKNWFDERANRFESLAEFESEVEHLEKWQEQSFNILPTNVIELTELRGNISGQRGFYQESFGWSEKAYQLYVKENVEDGELLAKLSNSLGFSYGALGSPQQALEYTEKALEIQKDLFGENHPDTATFYNNVGSTYGALGNHQMALEYKEKALEILKELFGEKHPDTANSYNNVGGTYGALGNHQKALEHKEKALEIQKELFGENHPDTATFYNNVGSTYGELGNYQKALEYIEKALKIRKELFGERHPAIANSYNNVGGIYGELGNHQKALEYIEKSLEILKELFGERHPAIANSYNNVGSTYGELENHQKALEYKEIALEIRKELFGENHPDTANSYNNVGSTYGKLGNHQMALEYKEKALEILKELFGEKHPDTANSYNNVGFTYGELENHQKALEHKEIALEIRKELFGEKHPDTANSYNNVGFTYGKLGNYQMALEYFEKAFSILLDIFGNKHPQTKLVGRNLVSRLRERMQTKRALAIEKILREK